MATFRRVNFPRFGMRKGATCNPNSTGQARLPVSSEAGRRCFPQRGLELGKLALDAQEASGRRFPGQGWMGPTQATHFMRLTNPLVPTFL